MYHLDRFLNLIRDRDNAFIPRDELNKDYIEFLNSGETPKPYTAPPPTQDELDEVAARNYAKLHALTQMTPLQVQTWVQNNVTNLAQAQDAITTLAIAISVLGRRI